MFREMVVRSLFGLDVSLSSLPLFTLYHGFVAWCAAEEETPSIDGVRLDLYL